MQVMCSIHVCCIEAMCGILYSWMMRFYKLDYRFMLLRAQKYFDLNKSSFSFDFSQGCMHRITCSLRVWFSARAAASSFSFSWRFFCAFSHVFFRLFSSSLLSTLLWQFSRRDFCNKRHILLTNPAVFVRGHLLKSRTSRLLLFRGIFEYSSRHSLLLDVIKLLKGSRPIRLVHLYETTNIGKIRCEEPATYPNDSSEDY